MKHIYILCLLLSVFGCGTVERVPEKNDTLPTIISENTLQLYGEEIENQNYKFYKEYIKAKNAKIDEFCIDNTTDDQTRFIGDESFGKLYDKLFSNIILGSSDVVSNGSAFSYTQDKNKNTFNLSAGFYIGNGILTTGINLKSADSNFEYYSKNAWSSNIGVVLAYSRLFLGPVFYNKDGECEKLNAKRGEYLDNALNEVDKGYTEIKGLREKIALVEQFISDDTLCDVNDCVYKNELKSLIRQITEKSAKLKVIIEDPASFVKDKNIEFESKETFFESYTVGWWTVNGSYKNESYTLTGETLINTAIQEVYRNLSKFSFEGSANFQFYSPGNFVFLQAAGRFNRKSYLENPQLYASDVVVGLDTQLGHYYVSSSNPETAPIPYKDLRKPYLTWDFGLAGAWIFYKKMLGVNFKCQFSTANGGNANYYPDNYSLSLGPLFRLSTEKNFSTVTFTLNGGWDNALYDKNAFDRFSLKASAQIPFTLFDKQSK